MARLGLGPAWHCSFANEICEKKAAAYRLNFGPSPELTVKDIRELTPADLPPAPTLAWASFPCQDLSLAGARRGLAGPRSGTFTAFWTLIDALQVPIVVVENVTGALTSNGGRDFASILSSITQSGYRAGAMVLDAVHFVPQSRPRLFIVAAARDSRIPAALISGAPSSPWHTPRLLRAHAALSSALQRQWIWWNLPAPPQTTVTLTALIEDAPAAENGGLLSLMSAANRDKVRGAQMLGEKIAGTVYKRIRTEQGAKIQRAEVRFDQIGGCLRTPAGGSSRQTLILVEGASVRSRLLTAREAARLMGLPESYRLPANYNEAYRLAGDGLVIPVVEWLERNLLRPLAA